MRKTLDALLLSGVMSITTGYIGPKITEQKILYPRIINRDSKQLTKEKYDETYRPEIRSNEIYFKQIFGLDESVSSYLENNLESLISFDEMVDELRKAEVIILSDVHFIPQQKKQHERIIGELYIKELVVGAEFLYENQQKDIDNYIRGKINQEEFFDKHWAKPIFDFYSYFGYAGLFDFLGSNRIKTQALSPSIDNKILNFLNKKKRQGIEPPYDVPDELREEIERELEGNYLKKDRFVTNLTDKYVKQGKQFVIVVGALHATQEHLPKMIFDKTGIEPVIVYQDFANFFKEGKHKLNSIEYYKLREQGLDENHVLKIGHNFFMNTQWNGLDFIKYTIQYPN